MKKLFLLLLMIPFLFAAEAQQKKVEIPKGQTIITPLVFSAGDTISATATTYRVNVDARRLASGEGARQDVLVKLDSISTPGATVQLRGSKFGNDFTNIGSAVTWGGTAADTTIIISNDTVNYYRWYDLLVTRTAGKAGVSDFQLKVWPVGK